MDDGYQYHITMMVCSEQEDAIRTLFKDRDWPCCLNVLTEEMVKDIRKCGHDYIFSDCMKYDETGDIKSEFIEIKSEVVDVENDSDSDTLDFNESETLQDPIDKSRTPSSDYMLPSGSTSRFPANPYMAPMTSGFPTSNYMVPRTAGSFPLNYLTYKSPAMPSADNVAAGLPASGYISDLVTNDVPNSMPQQRRRRNVNYNSNFMNEYWKHENVRSAWNVNSNVGNKGNEWDTNSTQDDSKTEQRKSSSKKQHDGGSFRYVFCSDCGGRFITREELWKHRNEVKHELPKSKPVGQMKRNFSPEELEKMGFVTCTFCTSYFPTQRKLRQHYFSTHREKMPTPSCPVCAEEFQTYKELLKHKREKEHNDSLWRLNSYQCEKCGKHITKYENFKRHKLLTCGKSETELEALRVHPCEVCGKKFTTLQAVKHHMSVVHENIETICDICGKVCKSKFSLRAHKMRHNEKNRKFVCEDCGKSFFTSTLLKQHIRCHTKEKPFKCPLCDYTCSIPGNVHKHARNVHKQEVMPVNLRESKQ